MNAFFMKCSLLCLGIASSLFFAPLFVHADIGSITSDAVVSYNTSGTTNYNNHSNSGDGFIQDLGLVEGYMDAVTVHILERGGDLRFRIIVKECDDKEYTLNCIDAFQEYWNIVDLEQPYRYVIGEGMFQTLYGPYSEVDRFEFNPTKYYYVVFGENTVNAGMRIQTASTVDTYAYGNCVRNCFETAVDMAFILHGSVQSVDEVPACTANCYSNVLFIPGIMSSRLYENGQQLWEDDEEGVQKLMMRPDGSSESSDIYTRDVIETFDGISVANIDIYKSFLEDLENLKTSEDIVDYAAAPYDWRLSISDILEYGAEDAAGNISYLTATNTPYIEQTLRGLAKDSKTGKVTIVTHSNGGLVAKALTNILGEEATTLIDKIVFVGVPQLGTPQAIGSLLHGYDAGIPFLLTEALGREFAQNAATSYQLLPQSDYYDNAGVSISTPLVRFEDGTKTQSFIDTYGYAIDSGAELHNFLVGSEGRAVPSYNDLENPAKANENLLTNAEQFLSSIGSSWDPPEGIEMHQIGGVGEYTLAGITYKTIKECVARTLGLCTSRADKLSYTPDLVIDGDGTVVLPSALAMSENDDSVNRWWVNLEEYNQNEQPFSNIPGFTWLRTNHKNLLEIPSLRLFIFENLLKHGDIPLPNYITDQSPQIEGSDKIQFTLHSPLALSAQDNNGNIISENVSTIAGATFARYGEVQVLILPTGTPFTLRLEGEAEGSFALEILEREGNNVIASTTFTGIPSTAESQVTMEFREGTIEGAEPLSVDYEGDGEMDISYTPVVGGIVTDADLVVEEPPHEYTYADLSNAIEALNIQKGLKRSLKTEVKLAEKWNDRGSQSWVYTKLEKLALKIISRTLERYVDRGWIGEDEWEHIQSIITFLENN